jgi:hypothetical protein
MSLEVIGVGFGRTGTLSLKSALETLGFGPCYHMYELLQHTDHAPAWNAAHAGDVDVLRRPLAGYRSTVDWPGCGFWRELAALYPEARLVLSTRPAQQWYASFRETVGAVLATAGTEDPAMVPEEFRPVTDLRDHVVRDRSFGPDFDVDDEARVIAAYERHNAEVRAEVPSDRLLDFDVAEGWEPLCEFLGVPVPDEPFPRANDRAQFRVLFGLDVPDERLIDAGVDAVEERFASTTRAGSLPQPR